MIRVVVCQLPIGQGRLTLRQKLAIRRYGADFVCLPEYFLMPKNSIDYSLFAASYNRNIEYLARLSRDLQTILIGGTIVTNMRGSYQNTAFVFENGYRVGSYSKVYPTVGECEKGIAPGKSFVSWKVDGIRIGVLICADVLHHEAFTELGEHSVDIIFSPTLSPYRPDDTVEARQKRDNDIFVRGANTAGSFIVKTCAIGRVFGKPLRGRSLIASPWKLLWKVPVEFEEKDMIYGFDLDITRLQEFRRKSLIERIVNGNTVLKETNL